MTVPDTIALGNVQFFKKVIMAFIAAAKLLHFWLSVASFRVSVIVLGIVIRKKLYFSGRK